MQRTDKHAFFKSRRRVTLLLLLIVLIAGLIPFETSLVPLWKIQVVDASGKPIGGIGVRQIWNNYSVEFTSHEQDLTTDYNGYVTFPARSIKASFLRRLIYPIFNSLAGGHASWGARATIIVLVKDASKEFGSVDWQSDQPLPEVIIVKSL